MSTIKIVGIGGSTGGNCSSLKALRLAGESAKRAGAEVEIFGIRELNLPMYEEGHQGLPESVAKWTQAVSEAHGLLWASPLYHGSVSGAFKNAIDWLQVLYDHEPPYLTGKVVGLISTAGGVQGLQAINTMEYIVRALRGWTLPLVVPISQAYKAFDEEGNAKEEKLSQLLDTLGAEVVAGARKLSTL